MYLKYYYVVKRIALFLFVLQYFTQINAQEYNIRIKNPIPSVQNERRQTRNPIFDFATNLYLTVSKFQNVNENMLISPFSIRSVSALIYLAARGETADEIRKALLLPSEHEDLIEGLAKHMASTQIPNQSKFDVGNGIFVRDGVYLNQTYSNIVKSKLRSHIQTTPFQTPGNAAQLINDWVARITHNKIMKLVNPSTLSQTTSIFMANALYFSGQWEKPFDEEETIQDYFYLSSGHNVTVPMMQIENGFSFNYIRELGASAISLPFKDSRFEFIILKPDENLSQLERNMRTYAMDKLAAEVKKQTRSVFLKMPKFRLNFHYNLVDVMKRLGITTLFDSEKADLSGLITRGEKHAVSQIVHQTVLDINEKGAAAAAGTTISVYPISSPSNFVLDRPFLFLLSDILTGPVFIGRLENPVSSQINFEPLL